MAQNIIKELSEAMLSILRIPYTMSDDYDFLHEPDLEQVHTGVGILRARCATEPENHLPSFAAYLLDVFPTFVYGSNAMEDAGSSENLTAKIARIVLSDGTYEASEDDIHEARNHLRAHSLPTDTRRVMQSLSECVNHAFAVRYIFHEIVTLKRPLSEHIILETHRILTDNIDAPCGTKSEEYGGCYRSVEVIRGLSHFPLPRQIPSKMCGLLKDYNDRIQALNAAGEHCTLDFDPINFACELCLRFITIHPFLDGNSRTSRLILNAILFLYTGVLATFGSTAEERDEYTGLMAQAFEVQMTYDENSDEPAPKIWKSLATTTLRSMNNALQGLHQMLNS